MPTLIILYYRLFIIHCFANDKKIVSKNLNYLINSGKKIN